MKNFKSWLVTLAVLLCSAAVNASEFSYIVSEADGLLNDTVEVQGVRKFQYTSPKYTLDEPTNVLYFTFLKGAQLDNIKCYEHSGYPFVALAEFFLYDGDNKRVALTVENFETNAQESLEGAISNICDGDSSTFWHSRWSGGVGEYHYLKVTLPEGEGLSEFSFGYTTRNAEHGMPGCIQISSSPEIGNHNVSGECGENLEWIYSTASRELTIKGNGNMPEFESRTDVPWMGFVVESVVIEEGVTSIGEKAFTDFSRLTTITLSANDPNSLTFNQNSFPFGQPTESLIIAVPDEAYEDYVASSNWEYYQSCFRIASEMPRYTHTDDNGVTWGYHYVYSINSLCIDSISNYTTELVFPACLPYMDGELPVGRVEFTIRENEDLVSVDLSATAITNVGSEKLGEDWYGNSSLNFYKCHSLETVIFPSTLETIGCETFTDCYSLESINWTNLTSLKEIADRAFRIDNWDYKFMNITSIDLSSTQLTTIGSYAFDSFENLQEIKFPSSLKDIGSFALYRCFQLKEVNLSHTQVTTIHERTFEWCNSIQSVSLPTSLTEIKLYAFNGANSLSTIDLSNVQVIGESAFRDCHNLHNIDLSSVTSVGITAFTHDLNVTIESNTPASIKTSSFTQNTKFFITPNAYDAFCSAQNWANWASNMYMCDVDVNGVKWVYHYLQDSNSMRIISASNYGTEVTVPSTILYNGADVPVTHIENIFEGSDIVSIDLPTTLQAIGSYAFNNCNKLTSVTIPDGVTSIGEYAFYGCNSLETTLPATITSIGTNAFSGGIITFSASNPDWLTFDQDSYPFGQWTESLTIFVPGEAYDGYVASSNWSHYQSCFHIASEMPRYIHTDTNGVTWAYRYVYSTNSLCVTEATGYSMELVFPASLPYMDGELPIGKIELSIRNNEDLVSVDLSATTITKVGSEKLGEDWYGNSSLNFYKCHSLETVIFPSTLETIGCETFTDCHSLETINWTNLTSLKEIAERAFRIENYDYKFMNFTSIDLSSTQLTTIGRHAFDSFENLQEIKFPSSLKDIGSFALYRCFQLKGVELSHTQVTTINERTFEYCSSIQSVNLPTSLTEIKLYAFNGANLLNTIDLSNVQVIGESAFRDCHNLHNIDLSSVTSVGLSAFTHDLNVTINSNTPASIRTSSFTQNTKFIVPPSAYDAFCSAQNWANWANNICMCDVDTDGVKWIYSYLQDSNSMHIISASNYGTQVTVPSSISYNGTEVPVRYIDKVFRGTDIISIALPASIENIGDEAFYDCYKLTTITLEANSRLQSIGNGAFWNCDKLTSIVIPASVVNIGKEAFYNCDKLVKADLSKSSVSIISEGLFGCCYGLEEVILPSNITEVQSRAFASCHQLSEINLSGSVKNIGSYAFENCNSLKSLNLSNVEIIGEAAFRYTSLNSVDLSSATSIGEEAFTSEMFFKINNQIPATIAASAFNVSSTFLVPGAAISDYKTANVWNNYASRIFASNIAVQTVNVTADNNTSAIQQAVGGPGNLTSIIDLKVMGTINSYDIIALHDKMIELRYLDLSEARVVANPYPYYGGMYCTEDDVLGPNSFREHHNLISIKLPANIKSIGSHAFYECHNLTEVIIPNSVRHIEEHAFANCSSLQTIVLPNQLESIGWYAFAWGGLKEISFPTTLTTIENGAFQSSQLEIVRLPSSLRYVRDDAFNYCNNLKEVYTYTIQPTAINEKTFSNFKTARLYVPVASGENYYWDEGWKRFTNVAEFDEEYEYFYLDKDHTLDESTGAVDGTPDADLNPGSGLIVEEEVEQNMGDLHIHQNGNCSGSIIAGSTEGNVSTENLHIHINVESGRWYFFCFPFDLNKENISFDNESTQYVFRSYDGSKRAEGNSGWKNVTEENGKYLKAAEGYIFQCSQSDVLTISLAGVKFKKENKYNELVAHVAANMQDASWNFVGNPYLSYYDMADLGYDAPITVWNGYTYEAINPGDDDYQLAPFEAFFVQKPEGTSAIAYSGDDQTTYQGSQAKAEAARARRRTQAINPERLLVNITISNGEKTDRTRIVFNNNVSMGYELACDAAKFEATGVPQLYTIDSRAVKYAINERPVAEGIVTLGYSVPTQGSYTLAAPRMDTPIYIKDNLTGTIHDFSEGSYEFASEAGVFEGRFTVIMKAGATGIDNTEFNNQNSELYNVKGQRVNSDSEQGIYIKNNRKVVIK